MQFEVCIWAFFYSYPKADLIWLIGTQENHVSSRHVDWDVIVELIGVGGKEGSDSMA